MHHAFEFKISSDMQIILFHIYDYIRIKNIRNNIYGVKYNLPSKI